MSEQLAVWTPVEQIDDPDISIHLNLPPFLPKERIVAHVPRIRRLNSLGGIRSLEIVGSNSETSRAMPGIAGFDAQGNAFASRSAAVTQAMAYRTGGRTPDIFEARSCRQVDGTIELNMAEVGQRIQARNQSAHEPKVWAKEIDKSVRGGIKQIGWEHLTQAASQADVMMFRATYSIVGMAMLAAIFTDPVVVSSSFFSHSILKLPHILAIQALGIPQFARFQEVRNFNSDPNKKRKSLFLGPEYDRAWILRLLGSVQPVIKALED